MNEFQILIIAYIQAYNNMDVSGMLQVVHQKVVFESYNKGALMLRLEGKKAFEIQAEKACSFFTWRNQTIREWKISAHKIEVQIDYQAILAMDFSNSMKKGDALQLKGTSTFQFKEGLISYIKDES